MKEEEAACQKRGIPIIDGLKAAAARDEIARLENEAASLETAYAECVQPWNLAMRQLQDAVDSWPVAPAETAAGNPPQNTGIPLQGTINP